MAASPALSARRDSRTRHASDPDSAAAAAARSAAESDGMTAATSRQVAQITPSPAAGSQLHVRSASSASTSSALSLSPLRKPTAPRTPLPNRTPLPGMSPPAYERMPSFSLTSRPPLGRPPSTRAAAASQPASSPGPTSAVPQPDGSDQLDVDIDGTESSTLSESFIRARARWRKALAAVLLKLKGVSAADTKREFIQSSFLFSRMSHEKQDTVHHLLKPVAFKKGEVMCHQGEYPFLVYFIVSGVCDVSATVGVPRLDRAAVQQQLDTQHLAAHMAAVDNPHALGSDKWTQAARDAAKAYIRPPRSSESQLLEQHVQRVLHGWFRSPSLDTCSISRLVVPLFHLTAPDCVGERESVKRVSLRDCTVRALTDVTAFALRRISFRQLARGRILELIERAVSLKDELVQARLAHALRMHFQRKAAFTPVRSRLSLTPFASRALTRLHGVEQLRAAIREESKEAPQQTAVTPRPPSAQPSGPASARRAAASSASPAPRPMTAGARSSRNAATPPSFFPPKSAAQLDEHHTSLLFAQSALEAERLRELNRRAAARAQQRAAARAGDTVTFGFAQRSKDARAQRRRIFAKQHGVPLSSGSSSSDENGAFGGCGSGDEEDAVAARVWHAFPHAYAEAQWHVYSPQRGGAVAADGVDAAGNGPTSLTLHALHAAQSSQIEKALAKHDSTLFRTVVSSPFATGRGAPGTAPEKQFDQPVKSVSRAPIPSNLPQSASFIDAPALSTGLSNASSSIAASSATSQRAVRPRPFRPPQLNTDLLVPTESPFHVQQASDPTLQQVPILADNPDLPAPVHVSRLPKPAHSAPTTTSVSSLPTPLLSFFSADLLRHLESHYMRSTDVNPISYTGQWMFFHAPVLRDHMPVRRRVRKPANWQPFAIPDEKDRVRLERKLHEQILQASPLGVELYIPPPPPLTSYLSQPRAGERVELIQTGGNANCDSIWRHLSPRNSNVGAIPAEQTQRFFAVQTAAEEALAEMQAVAGPHSHTGSSRASTPFRSPRTSVPSTPRPASALQRPASTTAVDPLPIDELKLDGGADEQLCDSARSSLPGSTIPSAPSSRRASARPSSAAPTRVGAHRRPHQRHPSLAHMANTPSFRDETRALTMQGQATDWEMHKLREGRIDTSRTLAAEQVAHALTSAAAAAKDAASLPGSPTQSKRSSRVNSRRSTTRRATQPLSSSVVHPDDMSPKATAFLAVQGARHSALPAKPSAADAALLPDDVATPREMAETYFVDSNKIPPKFVPPPLMPAVRPSTAPKRRQADAVAAPSVAHHMQSKPVAVRPSSACVRLTMTGKRMSAPSTDMQAAAPSSVTNASIAGRVAAPPSLSIPGGSAAASPQPSPALSPTDGAAKGEAVLHVALTSIATCSIASSPQHAGEQQRAAIASPRGTAATPRPPSTLSPAAAARALQPTAWRAETTRPATAVPAARSQEERDAAAAIALYESFDPRRRSTQVVRRSLADMVVRPDGSSRASAPGSALLHHPYPPKHATSASIGMAQSHAYVYGHSNTHASHAMSLLAGRGGEQGSGAHLPPSGSQSARSHRHSAAERVQSLYQSLYPFTIGAPATRSPLKHTSMHHAYADFAFATPEGV